MIRSMTAFARAEFGSLVWEIRSVNHRYLDASFRLPENFRHLEPDLKSVFKNRVYRGKLECNLKINPTSTGTHLRINTELVEQLSAAMHQLSELSGLDARGDVLSLLRWPEVLVPEKHSDGAEDEVKQAFELAVSALLEMRSREGAELTSIIEARLQEIERITAQIRKEAPTIESNQHEKLLNRINSLNLEADATRLETELVILAQKHDVMEELDRLTTHVIEVRRNLDQAEPVGRRLDFLMQELNREANTLSSKAMATTTTLQAVDLKVMIEQIREQVQNIE